MKMKNILKYFIVGGAAVTMLSSCDLNLLPTTSIAYEEGSELFLNENDVAAFQNGVMASYRALQYGVYTQTTEVQDGQEAILLLPLISDGTTRPCGKLSISPTVARRMRS